MILLLGLPSLLQLDVHLDLLATLSVTNSAATYLLISDLQLDLGLGLDD